MKPKVLLVDDDADVISFFTKFYLNRFDITTHLVERKTGTSLLDTQRALEVINSFDDGLILLDSLGVNAKIIVNKMTPEKIRNIVIFTNDPDGEDVRFAREQGIPILFKKRLPDEVADEIVKEYNSRFPHEGGLKNI